MTLRIQADQLIDGTGAPPLKPGAVLIEGNRLVAAGLASAVPAGDEEFRFAGGSLLPGLVDAHTHISFNYGETGILGGSAIQRAIRATTYIRQDLLSGVTLMRVVGEMDFFDVEMKRAVANGLVAGPRMVVATRGLGATNGHGGELPGSAVDGVDEMRKAVRTNLRHGADLIKLFVTGSVDSFSGHFELGFSRAEIEVAVEEAHRVGKTVCAHAVKADHVALCVEAGVDAIEHGHMIDSTTIELMKQRRTWLVSTLALVLDDELHAPLRVTKPDFVAIEWLPRKEAAPDAYRAAITGGVRWACGTDGMHGRMADELSALTGIGIAPMDVIVAATRSGAELCGLAEELGTLEVGKIADLVVVDGDPLEDMTAMKRVHTVFKDGRPADQLERLQRWRWIT